jgi:putative pyruvate formate lyase activating enzyme
MTQYTPAAAPVSAPEEAAGEALPERFVSREEYETLLKWLEELEIEDGFYQELVRDRNWLPDFTRSNPFPPELSRPVWP